MGFAREGGQTHDPLHLLNTTSPPLSFLPKDTLGIVDVLISTNTPPKTNLKFKKFIYPFSLPKWKKST